MRRLLSSLLLGAMTAAILAGCAGGPFGNPRREVDEVRRTRDKEISEMEAGRKTAK